jgi:2-oxoglutarate dehydrogenase E2 component (dihydrolipoamide succinyltransferase)
MLTGRSCAKLFQSTEEINNFTSIAENTNSVISIPKKNVNTTYSNAALKYLEDNQLDPLRFSNMGLVTVEKIKEKLNNDNKQNVIINNTYFSRAKVEALSFAKLAEISNLVKNKEDSVISSLSVQFNSDKIREKLLTVDWLNRRTLPYVLYVFSRLLAEYPRFTSFYHDKKMYFYNRVNIGLAIDLGKGLKVITIEDPEMLSLFDLQMTIINCIDSYCNDKLNISALQNSTVTVTDLSHENILHFQPVLNANQAIVLGIGGDTEIPGSPMTFTMVFDHRLLSGQEVAAFLKEFKERVLTEYFLIDFDEVITEAHE